MKESTKRKRLRKVSTWMSDAAKSISNEDEILAGKKIVLKILRYMDSNRLSQKDLAEKLGVTPQYIHKFLHGQDCDIKVSTAIKYGKILNLKLIDIPDDPVIEKPNPIIIYSSSNYVFREFSKEEFVYNRVSSQPFKNIQN